MNVANPLSDMLATAQRNLAEAEVKLRRAKLACEVAVSMLKITEAAGGDVAGATQTLDEADRTLAAAQNDFRQADAVAEVTKKEFARIGKMLK